MIDSFSSHYRKPVRLQRAAKNAVPAPARRAGRRIPVEVIVEVRDPLLDAHLLHYTLACAASAKVIAALERMPPVQ